MGWRIIETSMHADLEKLLSMGKISPELAKKLDIMSPGRYCFHASWGAGKIVSWSLAAKKLVIDFESKSNHEVALEFAPRILEFIGANHFYAKRYEDAASMRDLAEKDPVALVRLVLEGFGNSLTPEKLEVALKGIIIDDPSWKNWWDKTRALLRTNVQFMMPARKGERIVLRAQNMTRAQAALEDYTKDKDLKQKVRILDVVKTDVLLQEPETLLSLISAIDKDVAGAGSSGLQQALELAVMRDTLIAAASEKGIAVPSPECTLESLVSANMGSISRFADIINVIPAVRQKRIYETLAPIFGDEWLQKALALFDASGARSVNELAKFLIEGGYEAQFIDHLQHKLVRQTLPAESLIWICRQRKDAAKKVFCMAVGSSMLSLIEQDHLDGGPSRTLRLKNIFIEDKSIIQEMIADRDVSDVRQFAKMLYGNSAFTEQERGAMMARILKLFPNLHSIVLDAIEDNSSKIEIIYVSAASMAAKKEELNELVNVKIPENRRNKMISRAEGDLRENGGYQDAKEVEKVLNRRRAELERAINRAQETDFKVTDTSTVSMGTKVVLRPNDGSPEVTYTILGAWDTDVEKHIVSYLSQVGVELIGKQVGDEVAIIPMEGGDKKTYTITAIMPAFPQE